MSSSNALSRNSRNGRDERASIVPHSMALNVLFPPSPLLPDDMLVALARIDQRRR